MLNVVFPYLLRLSFSLPPKIPPLQQQPHPETDCNVPFDGGQHKRRLNIEQHQTHVKPDKTFPG